MTSAPSQESPASPRLLAKAWFALTANERIAIGVVLGLFLLGLAARAWHLSRQPALAPPPPVSQPAK
jgi:hypothetical protein